MFSFSLYHFNMSLKWFELLHLKQPDFSAPLISSFLQSMKRIQFFSLEL